jgi:hypothetical protein
MRCLEHPVASNVVPLPADIFPHIAQELAVGDAHVSQEGDEVVGRVCSVRATVVQAGGGERFCEELLAAER